MGARFGCWTGFSSFSVLLSAAVLFAAPVEIYRARLVTDPSHPIRGLSWYPSAETQEPVIHPCKTLNGGASLGSVGLLGAPSGKEGYCVELHGQYLSKTRQLKPNARSFRIEPSGRFTVEYPIQSNPSEFVVQTVGQKGTTKEEQKIKIYVQNWSKISRSISGLPVPPPSKFSITPGVGISSITYQQSEVTPFSEWAATVKLSANYLLGGGWYLNASGSCNVATFGASPSGSQINIFAIDGKAGYHIATPGSPWGFSIMGGWNYFTSFNAPGGNFGFLDMLGPELMLLAGYRLVHDQQIVLYLKPTLITSLETISVQNIEYAEGLGYYLSPVFLLTLDMAQLSFQSKGSSIQVNSYTFAVNMRF